MEALISTLDAKLIGFEHIKELYPLDQGFSEEYACCERVAHDKFFRHDGFLFWENNLCISNCSIWDFFSEGFSWWRINGTFWGSQDFKGFVRTLLLASHEKGC